ncbi:AraC family transcriptional regulator [Kineobactrum sediminis]|uniref:AraC family transcriptional regulator n=1 Tax=Kineobactrum sediminis TaxID=1905677 RepID=A0A2N5Y5H4_9GAMM|nr:AraC family transcriptional regulator [Kineobactrum sediminis]PLW83638.1 AraC family transcriptional regulator [Kineobactrum sediminis]
MDSHALISTYGLEGLDRPDVAISAEVHRGLLTEAYKVTGRKGLGLKLGFKRSLATFDQLAYLMMSCSTLREATEKGLRYQSYSGRFSGSAVITTFSEIDGQGCYQIAVDETLGELRLLAVEDLLANIVNTARWVLGRPLPVTRLRCDYPAPSHADEYAGVFNCPVQFDAPVIQLFFEADILDQPLPNASPQSVQLYASLCEEKSIARQQGDVAWRLWQLIVKDPANPPDMAESAAALHCSDRTLRRRLQAEGWSYLQLIDRVREIQARRALSDPTLSVTQVTQQLGYSDHSGFLRAFRKWTGLTPREFRARLFV